MFHSSGLARASLTFGGKCGFATANIKQLKIRMKAVQSIAKITKAMKMVAASKMRGDLARLEKGKNFGVGAVQNMLANESYLQKKSLNFNVKKSLLVPFTSDRGLCGGNNSSIVRECKQTVNPNRSGYKLFVIGEKGSLGLLRPFPELVHATASEFSVPITFPSAAALAHQLVTAAEDCDNIILVYNEFKSVISSIIRKVELLNKKNFLQQFKYVVRHETTEPETDWANHYFYDLYVSSQVYHAFLQNIASEQSARMNAMENASKNANEMLDRLRLNYNKARQAKITVELCEIISGAAAV